MPSPWCPCGRRRLQCSVCTNFVCHVPGCRQQGYRFAGKGSLQSHMKAKHGVAPTSRRYSKSRGAGPFVCRVPQCDRGQREFRSEGALRFHMWQTHDVGSTPWLYRPCACDNGKRYARQCKVCTPSFFCQHEKLRKYCGECNNFVCTIEGCSKHGHKFTSAHSLLYHYRSFHPTDPAALLVTSELHLQIFLQNNGVELERQVHIPFAACGLYSETKYARVDWTIDKPYGQVILELDQQQHRFYSPSCDPRRDVDIMTSIALGSGGKLVILRINLDSYKVGGVPQHTSRQERYQKLLQVLQDLDEEPEQQNQRLFMYYDRDAPDSTLPSVAEHWAEAAKELSRCVC